MINDNEHTTLPINFPKPLHLFSFLVNQQLIPAANRYETF